MVLYEPVPDEALEHSSFSPNAGLIENPFVKKTLVSIKAAASERKKDDSLRRTSWDKEETVFILSWNSSANNT